MIKGPTQDDIDAWRAALDRWGSLPISERLAPVDPNRDEDRALAFWQGVCAERARWVGRWP